MARSRRDVAPTITAAACSGHEAAVPSDRRQGGACVSIDRRDRSWRMPKAGSMPTRRAGIATRTLRPRRLPRAAAQYPPKLPAAPGNTTGLSVPSFATAATPKK